jgi:hypothetical protein
MQPLDGRAERIADSQPEQRAAGALGHARRPSPSHRWQPGQ